MATTASTLPRPPVEPPSSPLPALPKGKPRKSLPVPAESASKIPAQPQISSKIRAPSGSPRPSALQAPQISASTPTVPTLANLRSASSSAKSNSASEKTVRRVISIAAFPQPPTAMMSPGSRPTTASSLSSSTSRKRPSETLSLAPSSAGLRPKRPSRTSTSTSASVISSQSPSLLNGTGDGKSISSGPRNNRISEGQLSASSPPQSRSSSAQGSYSTSATTFEDADELPLGPTETTNAAKKIPHGKEAKGNVLVSVRVRPDAPGHENSRSAGEWLVDGRQSLVSYRGKEGGDYIYDNVFTAHDNNSRVYDASAKRLVRRVMEGFHGTVFAYGMTGTGKTFSMQGTATSPGVIPLAITDIFSFIRETPNREFLLRVSYLEIYNEKIHDLLSVPPAGGNVMGSPQQEDIKLREDSKRGVYATPLKEEIVQSPTQLLRVIARGDQARRTSSTQYNVRSSRSHAVVQIVVESRARAPVGGSPQDGKRAALLPGGVRVSTLSLIDLAGSERAAESKERRTEGAHINKSLLTLGTVIARLSGDKDKNSTQMEKDGKHLPYRDSKLTRLLQPALSGNSLVSILCTIQTGSQGSSAPAHTHTGETLNTLKFAARAKNNIVSHAKRQEEAVGTGVNSGLLERYRAEIQMLRSQLDGQHKAQVEKEEKQLEKEAEQRHEEQMLEMQLARTALKERIEHLNRLILCSKSTGVNSSTGTASALGMHGRLSSGTMESNSRSLRSSTSQSTLGANGHSLYRARSVTSLRDSQNMAMKSSPLNEEDETGGEFADGLASLQAQNRALQADLQDKNRYINTLERRLLQARRSSHSRMSMVLSPHSEGDSSNTLKERDSEIANLRAQLEDKERMVTALRSAARKRDYAELTPENSSTELGKDSSHQSSDSHSSVNSGLDITSSPQPKGARASPIGLLSPQKARDKKKSVDEMSKILDEMILEKVESGDLIKGRSGSVRLASNPPRCESAAVASLPPLETMVSALRGSVIEAKPASA
ncbi:MAG: hypothetical protein Q9227_008309 [Pyrenula ochraceoflavens]